jgi:transposase InsO family protein
METRSQRRQLDLLTNEYREDNPPRYRPPSAMPRQPTLSSSTDGPLSVEPTPVPLSLSVEPTIVPNSPEDESSDSEVYLSDIQGSPGSSDPIPAPLYDPYGCVEDRQLDINSDFVRWLRSLKCTRDQVHRILRLGIETEDVFFQLKEEELANRLNFQWNQVVSFRYWKNCYEAKGKTVPSGLLSIIPRFRGKETRSIQDPRTFIDQLENVLTASGYTQLNWRNVVTLAMTNTEDISYWKSYLGTNGNRLTWPECKEEFLRHFDRYDQKRKSMDEFCHLSQKSGESIQSYLDRAADLARKAGRHLDDEMVSYYIKKGLKSSELRRFCALKEEPGQYLKFDRLSAVLLMGADQLHQTDRDPPPSDTPKANYCRFCRKHGHVQTNCRKYARKPLEAKERTPASSTPPLKDGKPRNPCTNCPNADHTFSMCPKNVCDNCKKPGHMNFNCPDATCEKCRVKGHTANSFKCPKNPKAKQYSKGTGKYLSDPTSSELVDEVNQYMRDKDDDLWEMTQSESETDEPNIVAATTMSGYRTMNMIDIPVVIQSHRVMAALDTRSTNSMIDTAFCKNIGAFEGAERVSTMARSIFKGLPDIELMLTIPLQLQCGKHTVDHRFFVADMSDNLIIGMDLFYALGFGVSDLPTSWPTEQNTDPNIISIPQSMQENEDRNIYEDLLKIPAEELTVLMSALRISLEANAIIGEDEFCTHEEATLPIPLTDTTPIFRPQFDIPFRLRTVVDEQISKWLSNKKIELGSPRSRWNSSLLLAPKRDLYGNRTEWRVCFDGRAINQRIEPDTYGIPRIKELFRRVAGFNYSTALDLVAAFHQMPIRECDKEITTFTWGSQRYQFTAAPFGMTHIPGRFQRLMNTLLCEHLNYVLIYIDDIFIFSKTLEEHIVHCTNVINTLTKHNLRVREAKCHFGYREAALLGHVIDGKSIRVDPKKVATFVNLPPPKSGKQVQALLGFAGYMRDYIPAYSTIAKPLESIKLLKTLDGHWQEEHQRAFEMLKQVLAQAPVLSNPDWNLPLLVATDASQHGIGGVLYQESPENGTRYLAFFSRSLNKSQRNYSATKRELLAIISTLKALRFYLYGSKFTLFTDHKALTFMMTAKDLPYMLHNWIEELLEFDFDIVHRPGIEMVLPDALSRLYCHHRLVSGGDKLALETANSNDPSTSTVIVAGIDATKPRSNICPLCPQRIRKACETGKCKDHCTGCKIHPVVDAATTRQLNEPILQDDNQPDTARTELGEFLRDVLSKKDPGSDERRIVELQRAHATNHAGGHGLFLLMFRSGWYWPTMKRDANRVASSCSTCLQFNIARKGFHPLRTVNATYPFDHLSMDLGQIAKTSSAGHNYFLVVVDICTRYVLIRPLENKSARQVAISLYRIFTDFGIPKILQSDNGSEFKNSVIAKMKELFGFKHRFATAYYPQSNGSAEAMVKATKNLLKKRVNGDYSEWCLHIPSIQVALNTKVHRRHHSTPFSLMFCRPCNIFQENSDAQPEPMSIEQIIQRNEDLIELLYPSLRQAVDAHNHQMMEDFKVNHRILKDGYPNGAMVMKAVDEISVDKSRPRYEGPFKILSRAPNRNYVLLDSTGVLYPRNVPPSKLKLVSIPDFLLEDNESYEIEKIMNHRGTTQAREYLVKWKGYPESVNSWVKSNHFNSTDCISDYWKSVSDTSEQSKKKKPRLNS